MKMSFLTTINKLRNIFGTLHYSTLLHLNDQHKSIQSASRKFAENELCPIAAEYDKVPCFPEKTINQLARMGLMGACIDKAYGGAGYDLFSTCLVVEELSRCCASTGIIVSIHNCLYAELVQRNGTHSQKEEFLRPFTSGNIGVFALSEHNAGSDVANISTTAVADGNDFILNGHKAWVTSAYEAKAGVFFACTNKQLGHKGITAFLMPLNVVGMTLGPKENKLGIRATSTCDIYLKDIRVSKNNILGKLGDGFEIAMRQLQLGRIGVASQALGIGQAALDLAIKYSCERKAFGEKLIEKQLVKSKIAKMAINLESARLLTWKAAALRDSHEDFRKLSSMAKYTASRCATDNANHCVQILGAKGFVDGLAERLYRDSRITQIYGGPTDIQKLIIADLVVKELECNDSKIN